MLESQANVSTDCTALEKVRGMGSPVLSEVGEAGDADAVAAAVAARACSSAAALALAFFACDQYRK